MGRTKYFLRIRSRKIAKKNKIPLDITINEDEFDDFWDAQDAPEPSKEEEIVNRIISKSIGTFKERAKSVYEIKRELVSTAIGTIRKNKDNKLFEAYIKPQSSKFSIDWPLQDMANKLINKPVTLDMKNKTTSTIGYVVSAIPTTKREIKLILSLRDYDDNGVLERIKDGIVKDVVAVFSSDKLFADFEKIRLLNIKADFVSIVPVAKQYLTKPEKESSNTSESINKINESNYIRNMSNYLLFNDLDTKLSKLKLNEVNLFTQRDTRVLESTHNQNILEGIDLNKYISIVASGEIK